MLTRVLYRRSATSWFTIQQHSKRFYHPVKGIFGNYTPFQLDLEQWTRQPHPLSEEQSIREAFQKRGHLLSQLDPLEQSNFFTRPSGNIKDNRDLQQKLSQTLGIDLVKFIQEQPKKIDFIQQQFDMYCGNIAYEFSQLISLKEQNWFEKRIESDFIQKLDKHSDNVEWKEEIGKRLLLTEALDHFLAKKFQSVKRYGCEGAESMIVFIEEIINQVNKRNQPVVDEILIGMPHRGRLNLLVNTLNYPMEALFHKLSGKAEFSKTTHPNKSNMIGDVLSHLYTTTEFESIRCTLLPNPSHLEVVSPMVCGMARGRMMHERRGPYDQSKQTDYSILPLQIHGDASFTGQGIIMETLAMANVEHYTVGGSIHLIVNNQIGYTTPGRMHQARSSLYCTDPLKMINAPVIHVNGDYPELVATAANIALDYQQTFHKDVAVNLVCFRRWGHNELDDPTFTNPKMYQKIHQRKSIPRMFVDKIQFGEERIIQILSEYNQKLNEALTKANSYCAPSLPNLMSHHKSYWKNIQWPNADQISKWDTSVPKSLLQHIGMVSITPPNKFDLHPTLKKVFNDRQSKLNSEKGLDWATAESLAFGSLIYQGNDVRISGQDVGRGTFSQRHCALVDQTTNDVHIPLNDLVHHHKHYLPWEHENFGQLEVCNSILSEEAVMAFEYGFSLASPQVLTIWEAQFGDFFNGAQTIIDTLLSSGEGKWLLQSCLTLLLPNGYDGAGPEHTSARLERFLQLSNSSETEIDGDQINWSVTYPTTPSQYFHLLRRQMVRPYRKPLVVMSPKILLRHPQCQSTIEDMAEQNSHFVPVLDDPHYYDVGHPFQMVPIDSSTRVNSVRSIVFCSGKHYYALQNERQQRFQKDNEQFNRIAIVRIEELCPFPAMELTQILKRYPNAKNLIWSQEEHRNMGAWSFVEARFRNILIRQNQHLCYVGRTHLEAPATGIQQLHQKETQQLIKETFDACGK